MFEQMSRRNFLRTTVAVSAVSAVGKLSFAQGAYGIAAAPFVPYSADSFFKSRVLGAPIDAARTTAMQTFMRTHAEQRATAYPIINGLGSNKWGTAFAEGRATDPIWKLTGSVPSEVSWLKTTGFHAPEWFGSMFTGTSDSPFVCLDLGSGVSVWGAKAQVVATRTISVGAAGAFFHNTNGLDRRNPKSNGTRNFRSRGAIPDAMVIRRDLVQQAITNGTGLGHVLHLFIAESRTADGFCHPMVGAESSKVGFGAEGERLFIKSTVDLRTRGLSPAGLVLARTLQQNGAYIGDNAGTGSALKAEQVSAARNPWAGFTGGMTRDCLKGVAWTDFACAPRGWQG
jgi:hypothetical protein